MQIRFDGPPSHVSGRFIEVEDDRGRSIKVGEWRQDGPDWLLVIPDTDDPKEQRMSGSIGEKLDQIIAEASAFSEFDVGTDDAFRLIVKLAHDIDNQLEDRLCPSQDPNGECNAVNEAIGRAEDLEQQHEALVHQLARSHQVQGHIRRERGYAEDGRRRCAEHQNHLTAQLSALHDEFRTAAQRLKFVANWLTNTYAKGNNQDAWAAQGYAAAAKEVLDRGLDWLVERNRNRGRGVMDSTAASKSAGAGSSPAARATRGAAEMLRSRPIQNDMDLCMLCSSGGWCVYASWNKTVLWEEITQRLAQLTAHGSSDVVWNVNEQRAILNLMRHYRKVD